MNQKTLTLALVAASIAVSCAQVVADIRIEAVGVATTSLSQCPAVKPLPVKKFYQYKVFGHFSLLTLGDTPVTKGGNQKTGNSMQANGWNRLILAIGTPTKPIDLFKSSSKRNASTGTVLNQCEPALTIDWASLRNQASVQVAGNTSNPSGSVVLCVDLIPTPPRPVGKLMQLGNPPRSGDKIPLNWKIER